ncbi:MAG: hypothetical protein NC391_04540 [Alistipes timonensis]|nr:hypothetical protein [Alistipes timonensis]
MKKFTSFLTAAAATLAMSATSVTWNAADLDLANNDIVNDMTFTVDNNISFTVAKGASDKDCVFRKSSTSPATVIVYSKGTVTFNATDAKIKSIKFVVNTSEGTSNTPEWIFLDEENTQYNAQNDTWTGDASTISFTDKKAAQITSLVIEYEGGSTVEPVDPTPGEFKTAELLFNESQIATGEAAQNVTLSNNGVTVDFTSNSANAQIDKNNGFFGTAEDYITLQYRYRAGGKSSNGVNSTNKGVLTLPCDGTLTIYAYNNQAEAREGQIVQNDVTVFSHQFAAEEAVTPEGSTRKVYPVYTVELKKGTAYFLWPTNQLMLYGFKFEPKQNTTSVDAPFTFEAPDTDTTAYDLMGRPVGPSYKGIVIIAGKKHIRR